MNAEQFPFDMDTGQIDFKEVFEVIESAYHELLRSMCHYAAGKRSVDIKRLKAFTTRDQNIENTISEFVKTKQIIRPEVKEIEQSRREKREEILRSTVNVGYHFESDQEKEIPDKLIQPIIIPSIDEIYQEILGDRFTIKGDELKIKEINSFDFITEGGKMRVSQQKEPLSSKQASIELISVLAFILSIGFLYMNDYNIIGTLMVIVGAVRYWLNGKNLDSLSLDLGVLSFGFGDPVRLGSHDHFLVKDEVICLNHEGETISVLTGNDQTELDRVAEVLNSISTYQIKNRVVNC